jgi:ribosomal protein S24E
MSFKIEVLSDQEDRLLERRQINFKLVHEKSATPKRLEVRNKLAESLKVDPEKTFLRPLQQKYGRTEAKGTAFIYKTIERANLVEQEHIINRMKPKEKKAEEKEAAKEEKKEVAKEAKKEQKKEEK